MKTNILVVIIALISGISFAQNKIEKCNKLAQGEQKICKDNIITSLISDYVDYPETALENYAEGTVYVRFTTDANQKLRTVSVMGNPNEELSDAAKLAIEKFANSENSAILAQNEVYRIPVRFELD